jgi:hypothetical protein
VARREDVTESPLPGTQKRLVVSCEYKRVLSHPAEMLSPLQSELRWFLRIVEGGKESTRCELRSWTGEFDGVWPAPDGCLAAVRWNDQTEAGLVLVELIGTPRQLGVEWDTRATNWIEGPVWTPDSKLLVLVENPRGAGPWWAEREHEAADDDDTSPGGTFSPGAFVVLDRDLRERLRSRIDVELPRGWFPRSDDDRGLGTPTVGSRDEAAVRVPTLGDRRFSLRVCASTQHGAE